MANGPRTWEYRLVQVVCPLCSSDFARPARLRVHLRREHRLDRHQLAVEMVKVARSLGIAKEGGNGRPKTHDPSLRRVLAMGRISVGITLPLSWCERSGISVGDLVRVTDVPSATRPTVRVELLAREEVAQEATA